MSGAKTKTSATQSNKIDPAQLALFNQNYAKANEIADRPFQPYTGEMIAPANPMLDQSFGMFGDIANNNIGASTLNSAIDAMKGVAGYQPGNIAAGHCLLRFATGVGLCTISDGTGTLAGFHARVRVTHDSSISDLWHWDGTYSFSNG